ncbi:amino acid ABC transporter permease [Tomitella gaofuii]|uniref:amino acid ABC transporter permease n=1 Tax=Tomitella gaofuii TaxID=2760083 RepID=UPI0015FCD80B|nr:amino acid ABC transporter permease [Tomitella gaofuii]
MSSEPSVLYDVPGPRARWRYRIVAVVFCLVVVVLVGLAARTLADNGQFEARNWEPFTIGTTWTTYLLPGLKGTLLAAAISIVFALILGAVLGIGRLSARRPVRWVCGAVVEVFRAIPVLIMMIFAYQVFAFYGVFPSGQLPLAAVVVGLTLYNGSVIAEILRAGILSLPQGQREAASSLGLRRGQTMRMIELPQAVTAMLPALVSQMVIALKDSALGYQIGFIELIRSGQQSASYYRNFFAALIVVGVIMVAINFALTTFATWLERRLRTRGAGSGRTTGAPAVAAADADMFDGAPGVDDFPEERGAGRRRD